MKRDGYREEKRREGRRQNNTLRCLRIKNDAKENNGVFVQLSSASGLALSGAAGLQSSKSISLFLISPAISPRPLT